MQFVYYEDSFLSKGIRYFKWVPTFVPDLVLWNILLRILTNRIKNTSELSDNLFFCFCTGSFPSYFCEAECLDSVPHSQHWWCMINCHQQAGTLWLLTCDLTCTVYSHMSNCWFCSRHMTLYCPPVNKPLCNRYVTLYCPPVYMLLLWIFL